ncbi:MAG: hypothetical protein ACFFA0_08345 [Promethearchaeota archaeon]
MILLTGFGPYGKYKENISYNIVKNYEINESKMEITKVILPVSWKLGIKTYKNVLNTLPKVPNFVILLGIHSNKYYHFEYISWNFVCGKDIHNQIKFGVIKPNLNFCWKTTINVKKLYSLLKKEINIKLSYNAGTYLCNYIYYWALLLSNKKYPVLFIHIPKDEILNRGIENIRKIIRTMAMIL